VQQKGREKDNFTMEKQDKYYLGQVIKVILVKIMLITCTLIFFGGGILGFEFTSQVGTLPLEPAIFALFSK
jgi:hypothetical protein